MPSRFQFSPAYNRTYVPAELQHHQTSNGWCIVYYAVHPITGEMTIVRHKLNMLRRKCGNLNDFKFEAARMVQDINVKLAGGWNPFTVEKQSVRHLAYLIDACDSYLQTCKATTRPDTFRSYECFIKMFCKFLNTELQGCRCIDFTDVHAAMFMEYRQRAHISARTYNTNVKYAHALFSWLIAKHYIISDPFVSIKRLTVDEKERDIIPLATLSKIREYFTEVCPPFVIIMLLIYFSGLRPREIYRLQVSQLCLDDGYINMNGSKTKTHKVRKSPLSDEMISLLRAYTSNIPSNYYLFSAGWRPGVAPLYTGAFDKRWTRMRKVLNLPSSFQLYSLRDCSAFYRLESKQVAPLDAMKALGHTSLSQTLEYANHEIKDLRQRLQDGTPMF